MECLLCAEPLPATPLLLCVGDDVIPSQRIRELRLHVFGSLSRLLQLLRDEAACKPRFM